MRAARPGGKTDPAYRAARVAALAGLLATTVSVVSVGAAAQPPAPLQLHAGDLRLTHAGDLPVTLASTDGRPHRVVLQLGHDLAGLRPLPAEVEVPAMGSAHAALRVFRGDAAWGSRHAVRVVALAGDTPVGLASAVVEVAPDPALFPRLRPWLIALGLLLLAAAAVQEWKKEPAT